MTKLARLNLINVSLDRYKTVKSFTKARGYLTVGGLFQVLMVGLKWLNSKRSREAIWNGLDGTNPHDSVVKSLPLTASQYCEKDFAFWQFPASQLRRYIYIYIYYIILYRGLMWIFINGHLFTHWIKTISFSRWSGTQSTLGWWIDCFIWTKHFLGFHWSI